jgi:hypothetical protein
LSILYHLSIKYDDNNVNKWYYEKGDITMGLELHIKVGYMFGDKEVLFIFRKFIVLLSKRGVVYG